jgi:TatA/E family protein of Tat protein translocase
MPGFGHWWVLLILAAIALIIFGPSRLPELGAGMGKAIKEFRKATSEMGDALKEEVHKVDESTPTAVGTTYPAATEPTAPTAPVAPSPPGPSQQPPAPAPPPEAPKA